MALVMTLRELTLLNNVYTLLQSSESSNQASYILQFLWRDLASEFDVIFTSANSVDAKYFLACILEAVKLFQLYNSKTSILVCDGGSAKVAAIKASHSCHGAYFVKRCDDSEEDAYSVEPWMLNPFNPPL